MPFDPPDTSTEVTASTCLRPENGYGPDQVVHPAHLATTTELERVRRQLMALEVEADRRVTAWLYVWCPSACRSIHRTVTSGLGPQSAQRCYSRDAIETRSGIAKKAKNAEEVFFGRRASLVALSASAGSSSRGHGEGLPSLLSLPYQRDHPEVTEKDLLRFLRIFRRATGHVAATQLRGTPDGQRVGESEGRGGCPATASVGSSGDGESAPSCRSFSPECRGCRMRAASASPEGNKRERPGRDCRAFSVRPPLRGQVVTSGPVSGRSCCGAD